MGRREIFRKLIGIVLGGVGLYILAMIGYTLFVILSGGDVFSHLFSILVFGLVAVLGWFCLATAWRMWKGISFEAVNSTSLITGIIVFSLFVGIMGTLLDFESNEGVRWHTVVSLAGIFLAGGVYFWLKSRLIKIYGLEGEVDKEKEMKNLRRLFFLAAIFVFSLGMQILIYFRPEEHFAGYGLLGILPFVLAFYFYKVCIGVSRRFIYKKTNYNSKA